MSAHAADSMQGLYYTNVPTATPFRAAPWYHKSCCVNRATGLSNGIIGTATTMKCANLNITIARVTNDCVRAWSSGACLLEKFATFSRTSYTQLETPCCFRYASSEANGYSTECFYSGSLENHAKTTVLS